MTALWPNERDALVEKWGGEKREVLLQNSPIKEVWVALVTVVTEVLVRQHVTNDKGKSMGLGGLFGAVNGQAIKEETSTARVIGVAATEEEAQQLMSLWKAANRGIVTGEELVVQVPFGVPEQPAFSETPEKHCVDCNATIPQGNRCRACTEKYYETLRSTPEAQEILEEAKREKEAIDRRGEYAAWKERVGQ